MDDMLGFEHLQDKVYIGTPEYFQRFHKQFISIAIARQVASLALSSNMLCRVGDFN
jgi:hypothetical protein